MTNVVASPFSNTFSKSVTPSSLNQQTILANSTTVSINPSISQVVNQATQATQANQNNLSLSTAQELSTTTTAINKDLVYNQPVITPTDYTLAGALELSNINAKAFTANVDKVISNDLEVLNFSDEWTRKHEKFNQKGYINGVAIEDLYNQDPGVLYDAKTKAIAFKDPSLASISQSNCPIPNSDTISLAKLTGDVALIQLVDKINTFGKAYDFQFKTTNFGVYSNANTSICSSVANALGYLSFDKLLNDEIVRKKKVDSLNALDPIKYPPYNGFLITKDYLESGWINIDQLAVNEEGIIDESIALSIRTKKIVDAKRILVKLLVNFSSSIPELNSQNKIVDFGIRVKNTVTGQVFDTQDVKNGNTKQIGNQVILSYGGKLDYGDPATNVGVSLVCGPCEKITNDKCTGDIIKVANCVSNEAIDGTVHEIMPQIRINPLIGIRKVAPDFTNTIDSIQWTTGIQNIPNYQVVFKDLIAEWGENEFVVGHLNVPRSFHYASGDASSAYVCGGFFNSILKENHSTSVPNALNNVRAWNLIGNNTVYYEIPTPGGYSYNTTNSFVLHYEEQWDGNSWSIVNFGTPTPKAMGLAGGGKINENKILGFGASDATFYNNGVVKALTPTAQVWTTLNGGWSQLNTANIARVSPAGYLKSTSISSSGASIVSGLVCTVPPVDPKTFFYADSNPSSFPDVTLRLDPATQLKLTAAMKELTDDTSETINTNVVSNLGIVFNGWIGGGINMNPFSLDKVKDVELTNTFEYMQDSKIDFSAVSPSLTPVPPTIKSTVTSSPGWFVDTSRNYPIKTMGTLYLGTECSGIATGGKTGVSTSNQDANNAQTNIKYSYFNDSRYSEFNSSVVNVSYEFTGTGWVRRDNLTEGVAFHTGVGDATRQIIYGGIHGTVEKSDISVSYPGCDQWEDMIRNFGGTWHRNGTTGLDREKRYASFSTLHEDDFKNIYYKVGDFRDLDGNGVSYSETFINTGSVGDLSGAYWSTYVNGLSGHITQVAYVNKNSKYPDLLDITYFEGGESWRSEAIKYEFLNNSNPTLPYAERESALDDVDQIGFITKNQITNEAYKYTETYKPDYVSNPLASEDGIESFPASGYFANKENYKNVINMYKYAGHPSDGGMWLWSRPTAGEELFHPSNIHATPTYYFDSCGVKHISGTWQTYESWVDQSFKTNVGLHTAVCWYDVNDCLTLQDSAQEKALGYAIETATTRNYRWTMGDFRPKANRLSPNGKEIGCFDYNVASDREMLFKAGYISLCDFISGNNPPTIPLADGNRYDYLYAWDVKNSFRRVVLCPVSEPTPHYVGYVESENSIEQISISGVVTDVTSALSISPSANWATYFDYVYEQIKVQCTPLSGVFFKTGATTESGVGRPIQIDYNSDFFATNDILTQYPTYTVNPTGDFVGYDSKCFSPVDYFNRIWFIPTIPVSSCCLSAGCSFLSGNQFIVGDPENLVETLDQTLGYLLTCTPNICGQTLTNQISEHSISYPESMLTQRIVSIPTSICVSANGIFYGCASISGCTYVNPCGLLIADCDCQTGDSLNSPRVFYHTGWFDDRADATYGCSIPDGFQVITNHESCENSCLTWWTSGCNTVSSPITGEGQGFYWVYGNNAAYTHHTFGFYPNDFSISGCGTQTCSYGVKDITQYWNFERPEINDIAKIDRLREFYDILSFGLPQDYVKPSKFTYSFYITRDGVGLDQFFYGKKKNTFVERWKFPHTDVIINSLKFNDEYPHIILNDGTGQYAPLETSNIFKNGSLSIGEIKFPQIHIAIDDSLDATDLINSIIRMSVVQSDISSAKIANYYNGTTNQVTASCNFESLKSWIQTPVDITLSDKHTSHYYPMTYDNFAGPISGGPYFLPRGINNQSQFSIIPTANSSAIRDRAGLWPWCDLLEGKATNKPKIGGATWYWDLEGNIWVAETVGIEKVTPQFCYDQTTNTDPLHRKLSPTTIDAWYPTSYDREIYRIRCQDKKGNLLLDYQITYDEVAGPEIIGSKEGFDYNIFGTSLKPRTIDLINYNNKPLNGPTQTWVQDYDEQNSIHAINWRRTELSGISGCPIDLYPYNSGTVCEMLSGGYYKHNIKNGLGYFCRIGSDKDTWIYSAPIGSANLSISNSNFFIQESPFAIKNILEGSSIGMTTANNGLIGSDLCIVDGFPPLTPICYSVSAQPGVCCYMPGLSGQCLSTDIATAEYTYDSNVCTLYVSTPITITALDVSGNPIQVPCVSAGLLDPYSVPLSAMGFFSFGQVAPSGYTAPYKAIGWIPCIATYNSYGSEIVRGIKYSNLLTDGGLVSSAYITGPQSFGLGGLGFGKSSAMCGRLLYSGERAPALYSQFHTSLNDEMPEDAAIGAAWPWNIIGFDGLLGPSGYTDAIDDEGNYWIAIGDINNTNPYTDKNFVSFDQLSFKNFYTIIKISVDKKSEFFNTVVARTNWKEVDGNNLASTLCLSNSFDLIAEDIRGTRYREAVLEAVNMAEGQRYYDLYVNIIQENKTNIYENPTIVDKVNYKPTTFASSTSLEQISGAYVLPVEPLVEIPNVKPIQQLDLVSQFDINCASCYICDESFLTDSPSASNWKQHNHEEWVAPYLESPFAGPYSEQGFNIWLTVGSEPRWGVSLWSSIKEGKVWANYRRQRLHLDTYRNHLVLASLTAAIAVDDFEAISTSSYNLSGATGHVPVYVNYDEFIYCLDDYSNSKIVIDLMSKQTSSSTNGVECTDSIIASVNDNLANYVSNNILANNISGASCLGVTTPCSGFDISTIRGINEGYVEWVTSFVQEYRTNNADATKYYFKYNLNSNMDSNTYMDQLCVNKNDIVPYQWRRYQDGVGLGGDAPSFNLFDDNNEFTCNRINQWFIGQAAVGTPDKAIIAGGYAIAGDGELHRSHAWWESPTFGVTFKWNSNVIQPEDTSNINYKYRTLSPFWSNGDNAGAQATMGVTIFDVAGNTKVERQGVAKFEENTLSYSVIFTEPIPDYLVNKDKYCITLVASDNVKVWWEDKTATGFTIKAEVSFSGFVDWSAYLEDTIPAANVDSLGEQETFEQFDEL